MDIFDQKGASQVDILNVKVSFLLELSFPITLHCNEWKMTYDTELEDLPNLDELQGQ